MDRLSSSEPTTLSSSLPSLSSLSSLSLELAFRAQASTGGAPAFRATRGGRSSVCFGSCPSKQNTGCSAMEMLSDGTTAKPGHVPLERGSGREREQPPVSATACSRSSMQSWRKKQEGPSPLETASASVSFEARQPGGTGLCWVVACGCDCGGRHPPKMGLSISCRWSGVRRGCATASRVSDT
jgi:hypothetical protein